MDRWFVLVVGVGERWVMVSFLLSFLLFPLSCLACLLACLALTEGEVRCGKL